MEWYRQREGQGHREIYIQKRLFNTVPNTVVNAGNTSEHNTVHVSYMCRDLLTISTKGEMKQGTDRKCGEGEGHHFQ